MFSEHCDNKSVPGGSEKTARRADGFTHVYFGGLGESTNWMDVVVEDDDPDHDTQTEGHGLLAAETTSILAEFK